MQCMLCFDNLGRTSSFACGAGGAAALSYVRVQRVRQALDTTPGSFRIDLDQDGLPTVSLEWQAVFTAGGIAFLDVGSMRVGVCLLLNGKHASAEQAIIDSLQATLGDGREALAGAFATLRAEARRPLLAILQMADGADADALSAAAMAARALAAAFFRTPLPADGARREGAPCSSAHPAVA